MGLQKNVLLLSMLKTIMLLNIFEETWFFDEQKVKNIG